MSDEGIKHICEALIAIAFFLLLGFLAWLALRD